MIVALVSLAVFFTALDQTVVVTVLPEIMLDMEIPPSGLGDASWIITGYLLGYTVAIPLVARLSDAYGHANLFRWSMVVFGIGSTFVALAPDLPWLVAARVVQAVGGGAVIPIGMALVIRALPGHRGALAVGIVGAAAEMGVVLGPLYGGAIAQAFGWRWLFWLDVPQAVVILISLSVLHNKRGDQTKIDYLGGLLLTATLTTLVVGLSQINNLQLSSLQVYLFMIAGALMFMAFVLVERKVEQPLIPAYMFRSMPVIFACITKLLVGASIIIALVTVPLMANTVMGLTSFQGGLLLMCLTGAVPVGALIGGYLSYRRYQRLVTPGGLSLASIGLFLMMRWEPVVGNVELSIHLAVVGLGFGLVIAPLFVTVMNVAPSHYKATAASMVTVNRMIGMSFGLAALSAWGTGRFFSLTSGIHSAAASEYSSRITEASVTLFQEFFLVAMLLCLLALVPAMAMNARRVI